MKVYVDDMLICVDQDIAEDLFDKFNSYHPMIQFTREFEKDRQIPFLDINIEIDEQQNIITDWYSKPTASGRCLNFHSQHPMTQKLAIIKNMVWRSENLSHDKYKEKI